MPDLPDQDRQTQQEILHLLLTTSPAHWSVDELVRALAADETNFEERDLVERSIRHLAAVGLVHRHVPFVFATRAAVAAYELAD